MSNRKTRQSVSRDKELLSLRGSGVSDISLGVARQSDHPIHSYRMYLAGPDLMRKLACTHVLRNLNWASDQSEGAVGINLNTALPSD